MYRMSSQQRGIPDEAAKDIFVFGFRVNGRCVVEVRDGIGCTGDDTTAGDLLPCASGEYACLACDAELGIRDRPDGRTWRYGVV